MADTVEAIHISPEHERLPEPVESVEAVPGAGVRGDGYFNDESHGEGKDLTLIEAEAIEGFRADTGLELTAAETRRQVLTRGIGLNDLVGKRFRVGRGRVRRPDSVRAVQPPAVAHQGRCAARARAPWRPASGRGQRRHDRGRRPGRAARLDPA